DMTVASGVTPFAAALRRAVLRSEQRRMRALAITLTALLVAVVAVMNALPDVNARLFNGGIPTWVPIVWMGPFVAYEWLAFGIISVVIRRDRDFPHIGRFANALIETSLPSVMTYIIADYMEPRAVFAYWPPLLYFLFIVLSTLRLDFW